MPEEDKKENSNEIKQNNTSNDGNPKNNNTANANKVNTQPNDTSENVGVNSTDKENNQINQGQQSNITKDSSANLDKKENINPETNQNEDELERLRKENERLKELQKLREENKRLSEGLSNGENRGKNEKIKFSSKIAIPIIAGVAAVVIVLVVLIFGFHIFSSSVGVSSLKPSVNPSASGAFFLGPDGKSLGSTYINGLADLSSQLAQVGAEQVAGSLQYEPPTKTSNGPSPGYYVLVYGSGSGQNYDIIPITVPSNISKNKSISSDGKPTFVYIGAQGCPYCAGMRWAITIALSRFGNFSKLFYDRSATNDANVPTLMFNFSQTLFNQATSDPSINGQVPYGDENPEPFQTGAYYASKYINFEPFDEYGGSFLINTTGIGQISPTIYNNVYLEGMNGVKTSGQTVTSANGFNITNFFVGGVPFFDINNQYVFDGANINAGTYLTSSGLNPAYSTHQDMLNSIENPTSGSFGQTVLGSANILTAQICTVINNTAPVCSLSYIQSLQKEISSLNYSKEY